MTALRAHADRYTSRPVDYRNYIDGRFVDGALQASRELKFGETYINREHFEAIQGFHAGRRKSGIDGADGKHGLHEFTETHVVYIQGR